MLGKIEGRRRRDDRGWGGWIASLPGWSEVWVNSGSWWWTGGLACCSPLGRKESDMTEWLNWTLSIYLSISIFTKREEKREITTVNLLVVKWRCHLTWETFLRNYDQCKLQKIQRKYNIWYQVPYKFIITWQVYKSPNIMCREYIPKEIQMQWLFKRQRSYMQLNNQKWVKKTTKLIWALEIK